MILLWYASFLISVFTLIIGVVKRSWRFMLICMVSFIPIAYYFSGAVSALKYIGFTPIIPLLIALYFGLSRKKVKVVS
ncbi:hypothetical protein CSV79_01365 [Sporosarcina sp. P13]|uniref:hypothetical protein n=1 Tax=Sporosarcina sp. P13 TaxID=2048263 RepID=UPI000C167D75|nr:hypothetical protein [Sporosarcina sp. P13]PIC65299.1 hypothetical protein CSV79_01365 [Sporosarcina sp. P13]